MPTDVSDAGRAVSFPTNGHEVTQVSDEADLNELQDYRLGGMQELRLPVSVRGD